MEIPAVIVKVRKEDIVSRGEKNAEVIADDGNGKKFTRHIRSVGKVYGMDLFVDRTGLHYWLLD